VLAASNSISAPAGYASNRFSFTRIPTDTALPASGSMRFAQATAAGAPFSLSAVVETRYQEVVFSRANGYSETSSGVKYRFQNVRTDVGVVGATR
jgi:hypothetical protein